MSIIHKQFKGRKADILKFGGGDARTGAATFEKEMDINDYRTTTDPRNLVAVPLVIALDPL